MGLHNDDDAANRQERGDDDLPPLLYYYPHVDCLCQHHDYYHNTIGNNQHRLME